MSSPRSVYSMATSQILNKEVSQAVETLFESQSIAGIKEVETKTRAEIDGKKKQLRALVGDSYRDVISSADTILAMQKSCQTVLANIKDLQSGLIRLSKKAASKSDVKQEDLRMERTNQLYAIGSRVRYLVDTPEIIWGFLDTHAYLEAAKRFMQAGEIHRLLTGSTPSELKTRFPLVGALWPNIEKFRDQLLDRVNARLRQQELAIATDAGQALSAAALLQSLNSEQALEVFLKARQTALSRILDVQKQGQLIDITTASESLKEALQLLQQCIWQVGRIFLTEHGDSQAALISVLPFEDGATAQLAFTPLRMEGTGAEVSEHSAWQNKLDDLKKDLVALKSEIVVQHVQAFLTSAAELIKVYGSSITPSGDRTAELVAEAEMQLRSAIGSWKTNEPTEGFQALTTQQSEHLRTPRAPGTPRTPFTPSTPWTPFTRQHSGKPREVELPGGWPATCEWVLKNPISLWELLLEPIFEQLERNFIQTSFSGLESRLSEAIQNCLSLACSTEDAPHGRTGVGNEPEPAHAQQTASGSWKRPRSDDTMTLVAESPAAAHGQSQSWRTHLGAIKAEYNGGLRQILNDTQILIAAQEDIVRKQRPRRMSSSGRPFSGRDATAPRAVQLQKDVQSYCEQFAGNLKESLQQALQDSMTSAPDAASHSDNTVESVILIAQLSLVFGSSQSTMALVLGPAESWRLLTAPSQGSSAPPKPARRGDASRSSFGTIQESFRDIAKRAHAVWAQWVAHSLSRTLEHALKADPCIQAKNPLTTWQETVVRQEEDGETVKEDGGEDAQETRFFLPGMPSSHIMVLLLAVSRELQRAGGIAPGSTALLTLRHQLGQAIVSTYKRCLDPDAELGKALTETGALQVLFDTRLLRDFLVGGSTSKHTAPWSNSGQDHDFTELDVEFDGLEQSLQERLDPIDWAIYAMYLWKGEALFFQRIKVLCGSLLHGNKAHSQVANKSASLTEANIMSLAPTPSRFAYLPVSVPLIPVNQGAPLPSIVKLIGIEEESWDSSYSFAKLDSLSTRRQSELSVDVADSASSEMGSKRTGQTLGVLGSLLGDRAAEVTAMAQQSFHDLSLPSAFSNLSGPASGAGGLFSSLRGLRGTSE